MFCCRRRSSLVQSSVVIISQDSQTNLEADPAADGLNEIDSDIAAWVFAASANDPCPICFEVPDFDNEISFEEVQTHSWENADRCDAHGVCRTCLQQYVEMKLMHEGIWNIRCPGEGCRYQLLSEDINNALRDSEQKQHAQYMYEKLRTENCSLRLQSVLKSAVDKEDESWVFKECQACPRCFILARREDGCNHLVCRCGCHFCWMCGGESSWEASSCCCEEFKLHHRPRRAYLAAWLSFKHTSHIALGDCHELVKMALKHQIDYNPLVVAKWERLAFAQATRDFKSAWRLARERGIYLYQEKAAEEWALQEVRGTANALQVRRICESFGAAVVRSGISEISVEELHSCQQWKHDEQFEGLLVNSTHTARAEEHDADWEDWQERMEEGAQDNLFEDEEFIGARGRRRMYGAYGRMRIECAWIEGVHMKAKVPTHPKQQKQRLVVGARCDTAAARHIRCLRTVQRRQSARR